MSAEPAGTTGTTGTIRTNTPIRFIRAYRAQAPFVCEKCGPVSLVPYRCTSCGTDLVVGEASR